MVPEYRESEKIIFKTTWEKVALVGNCTNRDSFFPGRTYFMVFLINGIQQDLTKVAAGPNMPESL